MITAIQFKGKGSDKADFCTLLEFESIAKRDEFIKKIPDRGRKYQASQYNKATDYEAQLVLKMGINDKNISFIECISIDAATTIIELIKSNKTDRSVV